MTENKQVSLIAFSVLVLGMLGFFAALAVDLYGSMQPQMTTPPTPTPAHSLKSQVLLERQRLTGIVENAQFVITGGGRVLPEERMRGIEEIACYHLSFQYAAPTLLGSRSGESGDNTEFIQWGSDRTAVPENRIIPCSSV